MKKAIIIFLIVLINKVTAQDFVLTVNTGHTEKITAIAVSNDDKYLLSCSFDNTVILWDVKTGNQIRTFIGHTAKVNSVCIDSNNKYAVSCSNDKTIKIWDIKKGNLVRTIEYDNCFTDIYLSPDNNYILSGAYDKKLILWDINTGKKVKTFIGHEYSINSVSISPNGLFAASTAGVETIIWDLANKKIIQKMKSNNFVFSACFSPNSSFVLIGGYYALKIVDVQSGNIIKTINGYDKGDVSYSSDGRYVMAVSSDKTCSVWDVNTTTLLCKLDAIYESSSIYGFSSSCFLKNNQILTIDQDEKICLWDLNDKSLLRKFKSNAYRVKATNISSNLNYLYCSSILINVTKNSTSNFTPLSSNNVSFTSDNNFCLTGYHDGLIKLWDIKQLKTISEFIDRYGIISNNGQFVLSWNYNSELNLWRVSDKKKLKAFIGHYKGIKSACFSTDNKYIYAGANYNDIMCWDLNTFNEIFTIKNAHKTEVVNICVSNNGKYMATTDAKYHIKVWDINRQKELLKFSITNQFGDLKINAISFSPDCKQLIISEHNEIKIVDITNGRIIKSIKAHESWINSVNYSLDGKYIISGGNDGKTKIWNSKSLELLATIMVIKNSNDWVIVTPDGKFDGTENGIKQLYFVKVLDIIPLESFYEQYYTPNLLARVLSGEVFTALEVKIEDLKPKPSVKIISPNTDIRGFIKANNYLQSEQEIIDITVQVTDLGGGIDEILLYQNGKLAETTNRKYKSNILTNEIINKTFSITLINGINIIKATAFNNQRTESIPDEIIINYISSKITKPNLYLFVIGINEYKNSKYNLNYAIADALGFKQQIEQGGNTIFGYIKTTYLINKEATKSRIIQEINNIKTLVKPEDVFVFYYAGHGVMSEEQTPLFYIIPTDVTQMFNPQILQEKAISASELKQYSKEIKAQKQVYILDACQSGGIENIVAARGAAEEKAIAQLARSTGTYWLAASNSEQFAGEFAQLGHGLFTYCILQGLSGKADGQNDKKVTIQELSSYVSDQVPILSKQYKGSEQYPNMYGYGHDFPILIVK